METYCSACLKRCETVLRDDSFDHLFGRQTVLVEAPACHPMDDVITRDMAVRMRWNHRRMGLVDLAPVLGVRS